VTIIGSPSTINGLLTLGNAVSRGVLSTETEILGQKYYQLGASVNPGNSGGPAINSSGDVVGVVTLKAKEESIGFCVPVAELAKLIKRARDIPLDEAQQRISQHTASAVFYVLTQRAQACADVIDTQVKRLNAILGFQAEADEFTPLLESMRAQLARGSAPFDDEYRVSVSEILIDPGLSAEVRRDLRDFWMICDDMSRLALDPHPRLDRYQSEVKELKSRLFDVLDRLKPALDQSR
jgi:hypothetical protein